MELFFGKLWDGTTSNIKSSNLYSLLSLKRFSASSCEEDIKFGVMDPKMPFLFHSFQASIIPFILTAIYEHVTCQRRYFGLLKIPPMSD